jgi:integrase
MAGIKKVSTRDGSGWRADWRDGSGKRLRRTFATKKEAEDYLARERSLGFPVRRGETLAEYVAGFLERAEARVKGGTLKRRSVDSLRFALSKLVLPALGKKKLGDVRRADCKNLRARLSQEGKKPDTVRIALAALRAVLGDAYDDGVIPANPAQRLKVDRPKRGEVKAFAAPELERFLAAAKSYTRFHTLFFVMSRTGLRPGEARGLQWDDWRDSELIVRRTVAARGRIETPKNGKARRVELGATVREALRALDLETKAAALKAGSPRSPWIFEGRTPDGIGTGTPLDEANVNRAFKECLDRAGLADHYSPHGLRHTYASLLLSNGVPVQYVKEQLGHASIALTVETYGSWLRAKAPGAADLLDKLDTAAQA